MSIRALSIAGATALTVVLGCSHPTSPGEPAGSDRTAQARSAIDVGAQAPDAQLTGASGTKVALADVLHQHAQTVVVFYRGFW